MKTVMVLLATVLTAVADSAAPEPRSREAVVLLHGLARTGRSMNRMRKALVRAGYTVYLMDYPSTKRTVQEIVSKDLAPLLEQCQSTQPEKIHFVAHSLGNIVLRQYFATHKLANAGRIVMLGPPNQGSEVVDKLGRFALFDWINGPAGQQLGTSADALPQQLPVPAAEVGVIAGTRSINWFLSSLIPGADDGKVSVERTQLEGMKDFAVVPAAHPFLMRNRHVIALTLSFLRDGRFEAESNGR